MHKTQKYKNTKMETYSNAVILLCVKFQLNSNAPFMGRSIFSNGASVVTFLKCSKLIFIRRRKKNILRANRFQNVVDRSGMVFFIIFILFFYFFTFFAKITRKIMIFSCSFHSKFFIQIFVLKMADFTLFWSKKIEQMGKKRSVGPIKQGFLFTWPKQYHLTY